MSEEKPIFKVTDRRLFNADGTPREDVREEREAEQAAATQRAATQAAAATAPPEEAAPRADAGGAQSAAAAAASRPAQPAGETTHAEASVGAEADLGAPAGEDADAQDFLMVVEFIASFAAEALGMSAHPGVAGQAQVNLPLARQCIDMLATLERKTRGNLGAEEKQFLDVVLSQLRMHYVQLSQPRPAAAPPRGFTGGDITGGR